MTGLITVTDYAFLSSADVQSRTVSQFPQCLEFVRHCTGAAIPVGPLQRQFDIMQLTAINAERALHLHRYSDCVHVAKRKVAI